MQLKSVISALTLATALGLAAPAYAQVSIGDTTLTADEEATARTVCTDLQASVASQPIAGNSESSSASDSEGDDEESTSAAGEANVASGADQTATSFDVNTLTLEQCEESGLLEPASDGAAVDTTTTPATTTTTPATNTTTAPANGVEGGNVSGEEDTQGGDVTAGDAANTGGEESTEESDAPAAQ